MIASAVSASLGKHHSLKGNKKALSTVTAVIEGTGSLGASVLQILIPHLNDIFSLFVGKRAIENLLFFYDLSKNSKFLKNKLSKDLVLWE